MECHGAALLLLSLPGPARPLPAPADPCAGGFDTFEECWGERQEEFCRTEAGTWALCIPDPEPEPQAADCLSTARHCFTAGPAAWGGCYRAVLACGHPEPPHPEEEGEGDCSHYMDLCFDYNDPEDCSTMFQVCFHQDEKHGGEHGGEHGGDYGGEYGGGYGGDGGQEAAAASCVDSVRYCLSEGAEQGHCLHLILHCDAVVEEPAGCYHGVRHCLEENPYQVERCGGLAEGCRAEEQHSAEECYSTAEHCLETPGGAGHPTCLALVSGCYSRQELQAGCLAGMSACLTGDRLTHPACHAQLRLCLASHWK
jgi:hypothetical protein